jgi:iron complex outermembrane recepter protein
MDVGLGTLRGSLLGSAAVAVLACAGWARAEDAPADAAGTAVAAAQPAAPEAASAALGEVVVTARRTVEKASDVPIALSVVSPQALNQTGAFTLEDLQALTPSFTAYQSNPRNASIGIRGIGVSSAADGLDTSVGVYVDNVYLGRPGMALEDLIDIDQIEVLRGPQGTLFGRNSAAGVLNVTTKKPSFTYGADAEVSVGNYGYNQERLSLTGPLVDGLLAFRLTAFNTHRDGDLTNTTTGIPGNSVGREGARLQLLYTPSSNLSVRFIGEYSNENDTCCVSSIKTVLPASTTAATARTLKAFAELGYTPTASLESTANNSPQDMRTNQHAFSVQVDWNLGWANFTSISAERYWYFNPLQDSDNTPLDIIQVNVATTHDFQYSQEFRLASNPGRFNWQAGVYLFDQNLRDHYILNQFGSQAGAFYTDYLRTTTPTAAAVSIATGSQYIGDTRAVTESAAAFGQANYELTDRLTLTGGVRYTYDDKHGVTNTSNVGTPYTATAIPFHYDIHADDGNVSWLASAAYKVTTDGLVYLSYSTGYQSAGLNLNSYVTNGVSLVLQPERVRDWEVGWKQALFEHRLTLNLDGFWTNLSGLQANIYPTNGAKSYLANVGDVLSRGIEAEATLTPVKGLTLSANGSYNDAHYTSYTNAPCPVGGAAVCNLTGKPVYEAPRYIANALAEYRFRLGEKLEPYVVAQYAYRSFAYGTVDDGRLTRIPGYPLLNGRVGTTFGEGRYDIAAWVENGLNKVYFMNLGTLSIPGAGTFGAGGQVGTPRTYGVTLRAHF